MRTFCVSYYASRDMLQCEWPGLTFVDEYFLTFRRNIILFCGVSSLRSRTDQFIQIADLSLQSLSLPSTEVIEKMIHDNEQSEI